MQPCRKRPSCWSRCAAVCAGPPGRGKFRPLSIWISGGAYDWRAVKDLLVRECGWVAPPEDSRSLHTSCRIETCKEHTQFLRFYQCRSTMIPFSALELSLASRGRSLSRANAIRELEQNLGFSLTEVPACSIMREALL